MMDFARMIRLGSGRYNKPDPRATGGGGGGIRTRVRKPSTFGSTCLAGSIRLIVCYPSGREDTQRFRKVLANPPRTDVIASLYESTPGSARTSTPRSDGTLPGIRRRVRSCRRWQL